MAKIQFLAVAVNRGKAEIALKSPIETTIRRWREDPRWLQLVELDQRSEPSEASILLPTMDHQVISRLGLKEGDVVTVTIER